jgi:hypothetical protein
MSNVSFRLHFSYLEAQDQCCIERQLSA